MEGGRRFGLDHGPKVSVLLTGALSVSVLGRLLLPKMPSQARLSDMAATDRQVQSSVVVERADEIKRSALYPRPQLSRSCSGK